MDFSMKVFQTHDVGLIQSVMMHPDILETIKDDTWDGKPYYPDVSNEIFLAFVVEDKLVGIYRLHWIGGSILEGHAHVLKQFRKEYSKQTCDMAQKWVLDNIFRCKKVECRVPFVYPNVKQFLADCGFTQEGISRKSFAHNGQLHDMWLMGITKEEMEARK